MTASARNTLLGVLTAAAAYVYVLAVAERRYQQHQRAARGWPQGETL